MTDAPKNVLDILGPHRGPCAFCGGVDARHRVADAIVGRVRAGDPVDFVADDYGYPSATVEVLVHDWPAA